MMLLLRCLASCTTALVHTGHYEGYHLCTVRQVVLTSVELFLTLKSRYSSRLLMLRSEVYSGPPICQTLHGCNMWHVDPESMIQLFLSSPSAASACTATSPILVPFSFFFFQLLFLCECGVVFIVSFIAFIAVLLNVSQFTTLVTAHSSFPLLFASGAQGFSIISHSLFMTLFRLSFFV